MRRPSSRTWSRTLKTSGCAFSISSSRIDLVGPPPDGLGELAALLVADVAWRRADEAAHRVASPCTRSCRCGSGPCSSSKRNWASARAVSVLPTPGGTQEDERADRAARILEAGSCPAHRVGDGLDRLVLADDPLVEPLLHVDELGLLALHEARHGDAGPGRHDARDVVGIDLLLEQPPRALAVGGEGALLRSRSRSCSSGMRP